jgi:hypothetical protein
MIDTSGKETIRMVCRVCRTRHLRVKGVFRCRKCGGELYPVVLISGGFGSFSKAVPFEGEFITDEQKRREEKVWS